MGGWRDLVHGLVLLGLLVVEAPPAGAQPTTAAQLPRVRVIATGGTIAVRTGGRLSAQELVDRLPANAARVAEILPEQFSNVTSTSLTLPQYAALARRIDARFLEDPLLSGIVVTTGTDAMEELAYFLHLTVRRSKAVVVTGAMKNASDAEYDGPANLLAGIQVAADRAAAGRGVLVVMQGRVLSARDATKVETTEVDAFVSGTSGGPLGTVTAEQVTLTRQPTRRFGAQSEFDLDQIHVLPRVDVLITYQGAPGDLIEAAVNSGARGIVVAGSGAGSLSGTQRDGLRYARERGVVVVRASRALRGRVTPAVLVDPESPPSGSAQVAAGDLSAVKARILLMLAIATPRDVRDVQRVFDEY